MELVNPEELPVHKLILNHMNKTQHVTKCFSAGKYMTCHRNQQDGKAWIFETQ